MTTLLQNSPESKPKSEGYSLDPPGTEDRTPAQPDPAPPDLRGPWSARILRRRAIADLDALAQAMHTRQRDPDEILLVLLRTAERWRQYGAALRDDAALSAVRGLPGLGSYDPMAGWRDRWDGLDNGEAAEGIDAGGCSQAREWTRRALILSEWLRFHAGTASAEAIVRAAEKAICQNLEASA